MDSEQIRTAKADIAHIALFEAHFIKLCIRPVAALDINGGVFSSERASGHFAADEIRAEHYRVIERARYERAAQKAHARKVGEFKITFLKYTARYRRAAYIAVFVVRMVKPIAAFAESHRAERAFYEPYAAEHLRQLKIVRIVTAAYYFVYKASLPAYMISHRAALVHIFR